MSARGEDARLRELADRLVAPGPMASHVSASEVREIADGVHDLLDQRRGAEAEELRAGIEEIVADPPGGDDESNREWVSALRGLLDRVDARDSLAHLESSRGE